MTNLTNPHIIWIKGGLFAVLGTVASALLIAKLPDIRHAVLLVIAVWAFCRSYYFAFYVIEHYLDPNYRFSGLLHFARYAILGHSPDQKNKD